MVLSPEMISLIGGSVAGFYFKYTAMKAQNRKEQFDRMMKAIDKSDASRDKAASRDSEVGKHVRRFIVVMVMFSIVVSPFIMAFLGIPTFVEVPFIQHGWLDGLTGAPGETRTAFVEIMGNLITAETKQAMLAITGFYFGSSAAKI